MNSLRSIQARYEPLRSLLFGGIGVAYAPVGVAFANPVRALIIHNTTDANLIISYEGIDDNSFIVAGTSRIIDISSNRSDQSGALEQPVGQFVYVRQEAAPATSGSVYVEAIYAYSPN